MPRNGSGTYTLPEAPFVAGTVISSAAVNDNFNDIAGALTGSLPRDGQAGMIGQLKSVDGSVAVPGITFSNEPNSGFYRVSAGVIGIAILGQQVSTITAAGIQGIIPIGMVVDWPVAAAPSKWILCTGQAISRTTYSALFAILGTTYGSGDGSTTFNVPDYRGRTTFMNDGGTGRLQTAYFGADPTVIGNSGGIQYSQIFTGNLPAYTPSGVVTNGGISISQNAITASFNFYASGGVPAVNGAASATITASQGSSTFSGFAQGGSSVAFTNVPPGTITNKIIYAGV